MSQQWVVRSKQLHPNQLKFLKFIVWDMEQNECTNDNRYSPLKSIVKSGFYNTDSEREMLNNLLRVSLWRYRYNKKERVTN